MSNDNLVQEIPEGYVDDSLAPTTYDAYIGQEKAKKRISTAVRGAKSRGERLKHMLITGPAGTGKTTLAEIVASEMNDQFMPLTMTPNFKMESLYKKISEFEGGGIIMLDEIHTLKPKDQFYLLDVLEKKKMTYNSGKVVYLPWSITFIAATTDPDKLIPPMESRFDHKIHLQEYSEVEMGQIVESMSRQIGVVPTIDFCLALGRASAGIPRQARALVRAARDLHTTTDTDLIFHTVGVTPEGLTETHVAFLEALAGLNDGKAGIKAISSVANRPLNVMLAAEKLLIDRNYVDPTPSGRQLTWDGLQALKRSLTFMEEY